MHKAYTAVTTALPHKSTVTLYLSRIYKILQPVKTERSIACKLKSISSIIISYSVLPHILYIFQPYPVSCWTGCWILEDWSERKICSVDVGTCKIVFIHLIVSHNIFLWIYKIHAISVYFCMSTSTWSQRLRLPDGRHGHF